MTHGPEIPLLKIYTTDKFVHVSKDIQYKDVHCRSDSKSKTKTNLNVTGS